MQCHLLLRLGCVLDESKSSLRLGLCVISVLTVLSVHTLLIRIKIVLLFQHNPSAHGGIDIIKEKVCFLRRALSVAAAA